MTTQPAPAVPTPAPPTHLPPTAPATTAATAATAATVAQDEMTVALRSAHGLPDTEREQVVAAVVAQAQPIATRIASRYTGRGEPFEDLLQVARLGLVLAARRFDPSRGTSFASFAIPTVEGEVKRHFRDHVWAVRPPRHLQELRARVAGVREELEQDLGRRPSVEDIAAELDVDPERVREALSLGTAYRNMSLDRLDPQAGPVAEVLAMPDRRLVEVEERLAVRLGMAELPERTRLVLRRYYLQGWSQQAVADEVGLSQVQVGRIVRAAISQLRRSMGTADQPQTRAG